MYNISIIICTKNRPDDIIKCIDSLIIQTVPISELIIIDSGDNRLSELIGNYKDKLNIKHKRYKTGLTTARNMGIKESIGDIIIFLDDDVVLDKEYIYHIASIFKTFGEDVGAACGEITGNEYKSRALPGMIENESIQQIRNFVLDVFFLGPWGDGTFHRSGFPSHPINRRDTLFVECLQGANMAFRREVLNKFRFDENLQGYCFMEDCDISYRVSREYKIVYTPRAKLVHNTSVISRDSDDLRMKMLLENHYYLFKKNFPQKIYNKFAFWTSVFGLFFISFIGMRKYDVKGLYSGLKSIRK